MRLVKSLSYSSLSLFEKDPDEFFIRYLADTKAPRLPQENYMSIGSAFDAYVKADLHSAVFGPGSDPKFSFDKLFTDQVEEHNRDWAFQEGKYVFECYRHTGSYDELLALLLKSIEPPQFESTVEGLINGTPFLGKPDLRFALRLSDDVLRVILDFKVKGYCSKHGASPSQGYALCRDGYDAIKLKLNTTKACPEGKQSRSHGTEHSKYLAYGHRGLTINQAYMETCNDEYADQVSAYAWMLGETPGDENFVVWIDEIVSTFRDVKRPLLRVANHRARVSRDHQLKLVSRITECWNAITTGHIFRDMSRADSDSHCELLEQMAVGLKTDGSSAEAFFNECTRPQYKR